MNTRLSIYINVLLTVWMAALGATAFASPFVVMHHQRKSLAPAQVARIQQKSEIGHPHAAHTLSLPFHNGSMVIWTGPENDMLSFRVDGMRAPAIIVPAASTFHVLFINTDDDMLHDWRVGPWRTTFPNAAAALLSTSVGTEPLEPKTAAIYQSESLVLHAPSQPGKYTYFCSTRGHAQGGMWGVLIVR